MSNTSRVPFYGFALYLEHFSLFWFVLLIHLDVSSGSLCNHYQNLEEPICTLYFSFTLGTDILAKLLPSYFESEKNRRQIICTELTTKRFCTCCPCSVWNNLNHVWQIQLPLMKKENKMTKCMKCDQTSDNIPEVVLPQWYQCSASCQ